MTNDWHALALVLAFPAVEYTCSVQVGLLELGGRLSIILILRTRLNSTDREQLRLIMKIEQNK